ncbi:glycosyltransferase family 39 protein [Pseudarthrobacter sp. N5]|uniref:glycosyltransferase family 39 protein n=1 Tax=Pseudarthrobacter sp. N5 TaxID=3418416 RepID=UPI003CF6CDE2
MHVWTSVFGFSEVALRSPSALAVGLACAGTVVIGRKLGSDFIGITAGLVLSVLPRMVWAGTEARQSAFTALFAVALTLLLIRAWKSNRALDWVLYSACAVLGIFVFMFFVLVIVSHALAAVVLRRRVLATLASSLAIAVASGPFLLFALTQNGQVAWIENRSLLQNLSAVAVKQFFYGDDRPTGNLPPTWVLAFVILLGIFQLALVAFGIVRAAKVKELWTLLVLGLVSVVAPMIALLSISVLVQPVYVARYLTFTAPAFALLVALGLDWLRERRRSLLPIAAAMVLVCSLVPQLTLKSMINEPMDTERDVAAMAAREAHGPASIVYETPEARDPSLAYAAAFTSLTDLSLASLPSDSSTLWGKNKPVSRGDLAGRGRVLFVGTGANSTPDLSAFSAAGCALDQKITMERVRLLSFNCP